MHILKKTLTKQTSSPSPPPDIDNKASDIDNKPPTTTTSMPPPPSSSSIQVTGSTNQGGPRASLHLNGPPPPRRLSDTMLDHILGRGRGADFLPDPTATAASSSKKESMRFSVMDSNAEYWATDGVIRRSDTVTRRMNLRGIPIPNAMDPALFMEAVNQGLENQGEDDLDQGGRPRSPSRQEVDRAAMDQIEAKKTRLQQLEDALVRSLEACYAPRKLPPEKIALADGQHTPLSPSRSLQYIDSDGNIRQIQRKGCETPRGLPPPTPASTPVANPDKI
ncbi:Aste57867_9295 [Aphanomyces stellatus]|uniref:Aste57867_9295 protein n=1 Tax=Aphanomyces stellatus TaxID=120398 RepID=A0A485KMU9_9STRA|nr:hypothetical protein As57867_009259 [Aphanomyces stellatus]VFT86177.1 Aste57867_9295 [Aphanomyces stellatus]